MKKLFACTLSAVIGIGLMGCGKSEVPEPEPPVDPSVSWLDGLETGDEITFGSYEQDNNTDNGPEKIRWTVFSTSGDSVHLISSYCLDTVPFHNENASVTWETSDIRQWLNDTFLKSAFTDSELEKIMLSDLQTIDNEYYGTEGGNDTEDYVFLMDAETADAFYLSHSPINLSVPTAYAYEKGCTVSDFYGYGSWWIRHPGFNSSYACYVDHHGLYKDGGTDAAGEEVNTAFLGTRPCIQISTQGEAPDSAAANDYSVTPEEYIEHLKQIQASISAFDKSDYIPDTIDAKGFKTQKEAMAALAEAVVSNDENAYLELMPWPVFYQKEVQPYIDSQTANSPGHEEECIKNLETITSAASKTEQYELLQSLSDSAITLLKKREIGDYTLSEPYESTMTPDAAEVLPDNTKIIMYKILPHPGDTVFCYLFQQDGLWYTFLDF